MLLTKTDVDRGLVQLLPHYPEAGHNGKSISILADDWFDLLSEEDVSSTEFAAALRQAKKRCRFFPKLADLMENIREIRANPPVIDQDRQLTAQGEAPMSQEQIDRNVRRLKILADQIAGKITADEADRLIAEVL